MQWLREHLGKRGIVALGGGLTWAFAQSVVPAPFQPWLVVLGLLLVGGVLSWPFLDRHVAWRFALRRPGSAPASEPVVEESKRETGDALSKRLAQALIEPDTLHVGDLGVSASKLNDEHWLEFYFRFFNGSDKHLAVAGVSGTIECAVLVNHSTPDDLKFDLPPPALLQDRSDLSNIAPRTETIIVLQQFLYPAMVKKLQHALDELNGVQFYFDDFVIAITGAKDRTAAAILPLAMGIYLRNEGGVLRTGRVTRLQVQSAISTVTSGP